MIMYHFTNHGTIGRSSIMYFLLVIFGTLLTTWCLAGCGQQNRDNTLSYYKFDLFRLFYNGYR